jgi:hypothetical protein
MNSAGPDNNCDGVRKRDVRPPEAAPQLRVDLLPPYLREFRDRRHLRRPLPRFIGAPVVTRLRLLGTPEYAPPPESGTPAAPCRACRTASRRTAGHSRARAGHQAAAGVLISRGDPAVGDRAAHRGLCPSGNVYLAGHPSHQPTPSANLRPETTDAYVGSRCGSGSYFVLAAARMTRGWPRGSGRRRPGTASTPRDHRCPRDTDH